MICATNILQKFLLYNRLASFIVYYFLKDEKNGFSGKFKRNKTNISRLATLCNKSTNSIEKKLRVLEDIGLLEKRFNGWYHVVGNERFNIENGETYRNAIQIKEEDIRDIKTLRTKIRMGFCQSSQKYFHFKNEDKKPASGEKVAPVYVGSISYLSKVTNQSTSVIAKHRLRAKSLGLLSYDREFRVLGCTSQFKENYFNMIESKGAKISLDNQLKIESHKKLIGEKNAEKRKLKRELKNSKFDLSHEINTERSAFISILSDDVLKLKESIRKLKNPVRIAKLHFAKKEVICEDTGEVKELYGNFYNQHGLKRLQENTPRSFFFGTNGTFLNAVVLEIAPKISYNFKCTFFHSSLNRSELSQKLTSRCFGDRRDFKN